MDGNKSPKGSIRHSQGIRFLLALTLILSTVYVALEYDFRAPLPIHLDIDMEKMAEDLDITLPEAEEAKPEETILPEQPAIVEEIQTVELTPEPAEQSLPTNSELLVGNGEGVADSSKVEQAIPASMLDQEPPVPSRLVEQMPQYPGGMSAFVQWLTKNLKYPAPARAERLQGKAIASFIVNTDGSVSDLKIERSDSPYFANEALRVLGMMKDWTPGKQRGRPCRTLVAIPVEFKL